MGFEKIPGWENLFAHRQWQVVINVYVDDFKVAGRGPLQHVWKALRDAGLDIDDPVEYQTYLGCAQRQIPVDKKTLQLQVDAHKSAFSHSSQSTSVPSTPTSNARSEVEMSDSESVDIAVFDDDNTPDSLRSDDDVWDKSFDEIWENAMTASDNCRETDWVKHSIAYNERKAKEAGLLHSNSHSRVSTAQSDSRMGMKFDMPANISTVRCYEDEMFGFVQQCIDQYCQLAKINETDIPLYQTPSIDDHMLTPEDMIAKGKLHDVCSRIVLKIVWCIRRAKPDTYWAVRSLARELSKWTVACDKRLLRFVGYLRWSKYQSLQMIVGNEPKDCVIMYFADADFGSSLKDFKSTSGGYMMFLGPQAFVPLAWLCKKQGAIRGVLLKPRLSPLMQDFD